MSLNKLLDKLSKKIEEFSLQEILDLESYDRQFIALKNLWYHIKDKDKEKFLKLIIINALLSYQLHMKGEEYWENFSLYFSKDKDIEDFEDFLKTYNKRLINAKLKRLEKINSYLKDKKVLYSCSNLPLFINDLALYLNQKKDAKTLVFTAKMLLYGCRIINNSPITAPYETFIPIDSRLKKISDKREFWEKLSKKTNIPLLHIDSLFWITMGLNKEEMKKIKNPLRKKIESLKNFLEEIKYS